MSLGPFFTGQIPQDPMTLVVRDFRTNETVDLSSYDGFDIKIVDPMGDDVDVTGGTATIIDPTAGVIQWTWPDDRSLMDTRGEYQCQIIMTDTDGHKDLAIPVEFEVRKAL